ncbi:GGDEF domain-containing protein [Luteimonas aestuarii]|uniref:diguanylate cyclase n=1 Tax=Luteimonas aestuarii TaxID=453837 RepID=A0A4R5U1G8_9GAMM|nr:GGDEF domain-containing protein [Luteimonas aestuarii]TDK27372.1 GGDEF domain-containing protein [Luteimonas aestuarii]
MDAPRDTLSRALLVDPSVFRRLLERPDEVMLEHGAGGERLVAKLRAILSVAILALPLIAGLGGAGTTQTLVGLALAVFVNIVAQVWLALARSHRRHGWLPYATGTWDVTATSLVLVLLAMREPVAGVNSIVVWCFYAIAILMTALRNDGRLVLYVGGLAMLQYAALAFTVLALAPQPLISIGYGQATLAGQLERLLLLLLVTLLTCAVVYRMQRLVELSGRDGLTGLPNRVWLLQRLPRMFQAARAGGHTLTLALLDLDRFKRLNDDFGHRAGDRALRHVASHLSEMLEESEHLARIGGQEFVLVLRCPIGSAWERLDRTRRLLADIPFHPERGTETVAMTFSAGLAAFPQDGSDASTLLGVADRRLQAAKQDGRNRVVALDR